MNINGIIIHYNWLSGTSNILPIKVDDQFLISKKGKSKNWFRKISRIL